MTAFGRFGLNRRTFIAGGLALAVPWSRAQGGAKLKARKRNTLTSGLRSAEMKFVDLGEPSTFALTTFLETGASSVRVAFANLGSAPYTIDSAAVCEADGWRAVNDAAWRQLTFDRAASARVPPGPDPNIPTLFWSDWLDLATGASGRPQLLFRVALPAQTLPMAFPVGPGDLSRLGIGGGSRIIAQSVAKGNLALAGGGWPATNTHYTPIFAIQYRPRVPGVQIVIGGDSHLAAWHTFARLAALDLSTPTEPIAIWNVAWEAKPSRLFLPIFDAAIAAADPSIAILEGWTANDGMRADVDSVYLHKVRQRLMLIRRNGAITITLKGLPRHLYGSAELASWRAVSRALDATQEASDLTFDPDPMIEDPTRPGDWAPGLSDDAIHPNLKGDMAVKGRFEALLRSLL